MLPYADGYKAAVLSGNGASLMHALLNKTSPVNVEGAPAARSSRTRPLNDGAATGEFEPRSEPAPAVDRSRRSAELRARRRARARSKGTSRSTRSRRTDSATTTRRRSRSTTTRWRAGFSQVEPARHDADELRSHAGRAAPARRATSRGHAHRRDAPVRTGRRQRRALRRLRRARGERRHGTFLEHGRFRRGAQVHRRVGRPRISRAGALRPHLQPSSAGTRATSWIVFAPRASITRRSTPRAFPPARGHAFGERGEEIADRADSVRRRCGFSPRVLGAKTSLLLGRVGELAVAVRELDAARVELETFGDGRIARRGARERGFADRVVAQKDGFFQARERGLDAPDEKLEVPIGIACERGSKRRERPPSAETRRAP